LYLGTPQFVGMQRSVASKALNVIAAGAHSRSSERLNRISKQNQMAASPIKIQVNGRAYEPAVLKTHIAIPVVTANASAVAAAIPEGNAVCSASAAQIARIR